MTEGPIHTYKDLIVWQRAISLVVSVYEITEHFPREEVYGLTSQMRRCAVSIPANIAEGRFRGTKKDFLHFLRTAYGSGAELETHIEIAKKLSIIKKADFTNTEKLLDEVMRMLNTMIRKMSLKAN